MASVRLNGDTSGFIEISAPNVAGSTTITLPATSGGNFLVTDSNGDLNVDSGTLFVDASTNRVGIGTSSPTDILHINSSSTQLKLQSSSGVNNCILHTNGTTDSWRVGMNLSVTNGSYEFFDDVNNVDRMVITSGGNVGIGTTGPTQLLTISSGSDTNYLMTTTNNTAHSRINFTNSGSSASGGLWYGSGDTMEFRTADEERMRIRSDGNMQFNGTNVTTTNGNVGRIYKFFGGSNNIIFPLETSGAVRSAVFEFRRTGRVSERTAQLAIGENSNSQGKVEAFSSGTNGALSGGVVLEGGATSWASASDIRLKNVVSHFDNALQDVSTLDAFRFTWKNDASETLQVGLSAQSVQAVLPEATSISGKPIDAAEDDDTEYLSVRYTEVIPLLVAALQESKERIETLETANASLEARLTALEGGN